MEAYHKKRMREAVKRVRAEIINNGFVCGTNDAVPDLSMPSPMSKSFDEKKTGMTGLSAQRRTGRRRR